MKITTCDCCGNEITEANMVDGVNHRLQADITNRHNKNVWLRVQVQPAANCTWDDGDYCKYCIIDAIKNLDDRRR